MKRAEKVSRRRKFYNETAATTLKELKTEIIEIKLSLSSFDAS